MEDGSGAVWFTLLDPESLAATRFSTSFRGYSPEEVRQVLERVATEMQAAGEREDRLRRELDDLRQRHAHPELDETAITAALGDHAARLIASARESATAIRTEAEEAATASLREVESRVARARHEAESLMARRVEEAEKMAEELRRAAEVEVRALRDQARVEATAIVQAARSEGREMVAQARAVRERMLNDLSRRKRAMEAEISQLADGRDRLERAYDVVARTLDEAVAALRSAPRVRGEPETSRPDPEPRTDTRRGELSRPARPVAPELTISAPVRRALEAAEPAVSSSGATRSDPCTTPPPPPARRPQSVADVAPSALPATTAPPAARPAAAVPSAVPSAVPAAVPAAPPRTVAPADPAPPAEPAAAAPASTAAETAVSGPAPARTPEVPAPEMDEAFPAPLPVPDPEPAVTVSGRAARPVSDLFARIRAQGLDEPPHRDQEMAGRLSHPSGTGDGRQAEMAPERPSPGPEAEEAPDRIADEAALSRRDALLDPIESSLVRALKMALQDAQNELLDALRRARGGVPEGLAGDGLVKRLQGRALAPLEQALLAGAAFAGAPSDDVAAAAEPAARLATELGSQIGGPLAERIGSLLAEAGSGEDQRDLAKRVSSVFRQWKTRQVEPASAHQVALAFATGQFDATPHGAPQRWLVDDEVPCPDCDDDALAGAVEKGTPFPTGRLHPPSHHGCRCLLVPAVP